MEYSVYCGGVACTYKLHVLDTMNLSTEYRTANVNIWLSRDYGVPQRELGPPAVGAGGLAHLT